MQNRAKMVFAVLLIGVLLFTGTVTGQSGENFTPVPTIAFSSARNSPCLALVPPAMQPSISSIYLMGSDNAGVKQLTDSPDCTHTHFDLFAALAPDGKKIIFESNRLRSDNDPLNTSDLFLMEPDGSNQVWLIRGSSASWSPGKGRQIVFHASASGNQRPINPNPGAPAFDSDLFVLNVDDCLLVANCRDLATNITKDLQPDPDAAPNYNDGKLSPANPPAIDEDADWSPDGSKIVFTSHPIVSEPCTNVGLCNYPDAEIYVVNSDGTGLKQLTHNGQEERSPSWSPDGSRILYMCRIGPSNAQGLPSFEVCVIGADGDGDGTSYTRLTWNTVLDATASWSPDGNQIVLHRNPPPLQLWLLKSDTICANGSCDCPDKYTNGKCETQLTNTTGALNAFPRWGLLRTHVAKP
jgi:dipeptidyl aminopeptidase/acylaminoacyl peptidase